MYFQSVSDNQYVRHLRLPQVLTLSNGDSLDGFNSLSPEQLASYGFYEGEELNTVYDSELYTAVGFTYVLQTYKVTATTTLERLPLDIVKTVMWERIKTERERRRVNGTLVNGKWFHSDDASRIQQLGLFVMGASIPANIPPWKTMDGTSVTMTQSLAAQIFMGVATLDGHNFAVAEQHKATMLTSSTPETYDYYAGWLPTFGE